MSLGTAAFGLLVLAWNHLGGAAILAVAGLVLLIAVSRCGYQQPTTAYQGSICPQCGRKNWI